MTISTPDPPTITIDGPRAITVHWTPPEVQDTAVTSYNVESDRSSGWFGLTDLELSLTDQYEGSITFRVTAVSASEQSETSQYADSAIVPGYSFDVPSLGISMASSKRGDDKDLQQIELVSDGRRVGHDAPLPIITLDGLPLSAYLYSDGDIVSVVKPLPVQPAKSPVFAMLALDVDDSAQVTLLEPNDARNGFGIHNHSNGQLYLSYGDTASADFFTQVLQGHAYMEHMGAGCYTGVVTCRRPTGEVAGPVMVTTWTT